MDIYRVDSELLYRPDNTGNGNQATEQKRAEHELSTVQLRQQKAGLAWPEESISWYQQGVIYNV